MLSVIFEATDEPQPSVYESFEPTPALATLFNTSSGDVTVNTKGFKEMADTACSKQRHQPQQQGSPDPEDNAPNEGEGLQAVLDLLFTTRTSTLDISSCPDPKTKFKGPGIHENLLDYYDGIDVTTLDRRREW